MSTPLLIRFFDSTIKKRSRKKQTPSLSAPADDYNKIEYESLQLLIENLEFWNRISPSQMFIVYIPCIYL